MMDKAQRLLLEKKRKDLQEASLKRSKVDLLSDLIKILDAKYIKYNINFYSDVWNWICDNFPVAEWGKINWDFVEHKNKLAWTEPDKIPELFEKFVSKYNLTDDMVTIIWSNSERPAIDMSLDDAKMVIQDIFDEDWDTWMVPKERKWCIECHHTGSLTIGIVDK